MKKLEPTDDLSRIEAAGRQIGQYKVRVVLNRHAISIGCFWRDIRRSVQVKLVAVLDVEHEIPSVQVLHHEEEVLLDTEMQRGQCSEWTSTDERLSRFLTLVWKVQQRCVRKGFSQAKERTLLSTMVHSTSSSISTTSFFRAFTAKNWPFFFSSAKNTWKHRKKQNR